MSRQLSLELEFHSGPLVLPDVAGAPRILSSSAPSSFLLQISFVELSLRNLQVVPIARALFIQGRSVLAYRSRSLPLAAELAAVRCLAGLQDMCCFSSGARCRQVSLQALCDWPN